MAKNKVMYGVSMLHFGLYTVEDDGTVTLGTPYHVPGTVSISLEAESESNTFHADNIPYWAGYADNGMTGEVVNALFDEEFKTTFMNWVELDGGGIGQVKSMQNKPVYMMFQNEGDQEGRRTILYNVSLGQITRDYETVEESIEPQTATLPFTVSGDNGTGLTRGVYWPGGDVYDTMFDNPPVPALPDQSE